ncbi:hypothetical protein M0651_13780 [Paenibacillus sp. MBLB2552]|uniref:N-acetyltransferase domain-containing protein n=1 Tax=Paenibacillus mellifer TaxID=2937794 RepID=A0A9X1Y235_9BACL|nr:GNAT family N-acetyltransferase [Paenibacillus mellifer]MCK8488246.1 hypothetical protein [Paenibacillus mellifer]
MYKLVESLEEGTLFHSIWMEAWMEKGFEPEFADNVLGRCLVYDASGVPVGTVEFKPYVPRSDEPLNELVPFDDHPAILLADPGEIAEVDKVALLKRYRGRNLNRLLATIVLFAQQNGIRHYVTLLEPTLFRALRISFHVPMSQVGERQFYKGDDVVPAIIHVAEFYENAERFAWYLDTLESLDQETVLST